jgi:hypothetical protein
MLGINSLEAANVVYAASKQSVSSVETTLIVL